MHILLGVTDHGTPRLTRYRRVMVNVRRYGWAEAYNGAPPPARIGVLCCP